MKMNYTKRTEKSEKVVSAATTVADKTVHGVLAVLRASVYGILTGTKWVGEKAAQAKEAQEKTLMEEVKELDKEIIIAKLEAELKELKGE